MPYSKTSWVDGTTAANQAHLNNLETQYDEATQSFEQDLLLPFILSGLVCTKDGTTVNQLDVTAGVGYLKQTDNTLCRRATSASTAGQFTTSTHTASYYLDLNPDGTFSFATSHSGSSNYLTICTVVTDGSGNISTVTDTRKLDTSFLPGRLGKLLLPTGLQETGVCGIGGRTTASGDFLSTAINFRNVMTNAPSSLTLTVAEQQDNTAPTLLYLGNYGTMFYIKSNVASSNNCHWYGSYVTIGNCLRAVDSGAMTFDHHCSACGLLREGLSLTTDLTVDGLQMPPTKAGAYGMSTTCPDCGAQECFATGLGAADEVGWDAPGVAVTDQVYQYHLVRLAQRALGLPLAA